MAAEVVDKSIEYLRVIGALPKIAISTDIRRASSGAVGWPEEGGLSWIEEELKESTDNSFPKRHAFCSPKIME